MGYFEENGYSLSTGLHHSEMAYSRFRRRRSFVGAPLVPYADPNTSEPCVVDDSFGVPDVV